MCCSARCGSAPAVAERRSLITVAALTAGGNAGQLTYHLQFAKDNGATEEELIEAIKRTPLAGLLGAAWEAHVAIADQAEITELEEEARRAAATQ